MLFKSMLTSFKSNRALVRIIFVQRKFGVAFLNFFSSATGTSAFNKKLKFVVKRNKAGIIQCIKASLRHARQRAVAIFI